MISNDFIWTFFLVNFFINLPIFDYYHMCMYRYSNTHKSILITYYCFDNSRHSTFFYYHIHNNISKITVCVAEKNLQFVFLSYRNVFRSERSWQQQRSERGNRQVSDDQNADDGTAVGTENFRSSRHRTRRVNIFDKTTHILHSRVALKYSISGPMCVCLCGFFFFFDKTYSFFLHCICEWAWSLFLGPRLLIFYHSCFFF